jgi:hypothetical protein
MKLGMYIVAHERISTGYFINPSHGLCVCVRNPHNGLVYTFPRYRIQATKEELLDTSFSVGPCGTKGESVGGSRQSVCSEFPHKANNIYALFMPSDVCGVCQYATAAKLLLIEDERDCNVTVVRRE